MSRSRRKWRRRVGRVSVYRRGGRFWIYYRQGKQIRRPVGTSRDEALALAAKINAQLAEGTPMVWRAAIRHSVWMAALAGGKSGKWKHGDGCRLRRKRVPRRLLEPKVGMIHRTNSRRSNHTVEASHDGLLRRQFCSYDGGTR